LAPSNLAPGCPPLPEDHAPCLYGDFSHMINPFALPLFPLPAVFPKDPWAGQCLFDQIIKVRSGQLNGKDIPLLVRVVHALFYPVALHLSPWFPSDSAFPPCGLGWFVDFPWLGFLFFGRSPPPCLFRFQSDLASFPFARSWIGSPRVAQDRSIQTAWVVLLTARSRLFSGHLAFSVSFPPPPGCQMIYSFFTTFSLLFIFFLFFRASVDSEHVISSFPPCFRRSPCLIRSRCR